MKNGCGLSSLGQDRAEYIFACIWVELSKSDPLRVYDLREVQNIHRVIYYLTER